MQKLAATGKWDLDSALKPTTFGDFDLDAFTWTCNVTKQRQKEHHVYCTCQLQLAHNFLIDTVTDLMAFLQIITFIKCQLLAVHITLIHDALRIICSCLVHSESAQAGMLKIKP